MFEKLKRFWQGEPPPISETLDDPVLGTLIWSDDDEAWTTNKAIEGLGFEIVISGTKEPDRQLLAHAREIFRNHSDFVSNVLGQIKIESETVRGLRRYREEIDGLRIERVYLSRPDDGRIYFSGGQDDRLWLCEYIGGQAKGLGFDS